MSKFCKREFYNIDNKISFILYLKHVKLEVVNKKEKKKHKSFDYSKFGYLESSKNVEEHRKNGNT